MAILEWIYGLPFWGLYAVIVLMTAIIYQTAFARTLPLLKQIIVYIFLAIGCFLLEIFHYMGLPIIPALLITVVLIIVTRVRLSLLRKKNQSVSK